MKQNIKSVIDEFNFKVKLFFLWPGSHLCVQKIKIAQIFLKYY